MISRQTLPILSAFFVFASATGAHAGSLSTSSFNLWETCTPDPYFSSGGIIVPEGGTACIPDYVAAQESYSQTASGFSFYGVLLGGSGAPSSGDQECVYMADNVTSFTGHEMGFIKTLNNNALQVYLQTPGGGFYYATISTGDNGWHTYKAQVNSSNHDQVDFYLDGVYKTSLNDGQNYWGLNYYFVATTHRLDSGWSSSGEQIEIWNMTTY